MTRQGLPIPGVEVRVVNLDTEKDVAWNGQERGEVLLRGLWIGGNITGSRSNQQKFRNGWLHTEI